MHMGVWLAWCIYDAPHFIVIDSIYNEKIIYMSGGLPVLYKDGNQYVIPISALEPHIDVLASRSFSTHSLGVAQVNPRSCLSL